MIDRKQPAALILAGLLAAGCTANSFRAVTRSPRFDPNRIRRVLVFALFPDLTLRQNTENEFIRRWKEQGVESVSSLQAIPTTTPLTKEELKPILSRGNFDSLLVLRILEKKNVAAGEVAFSTMAVAAANKTPEGSRAWKDNYLAPATYAAPHQLVAIEASLLDVASEDRVWSAVSETRVFADVTQQIKNYVDAILKQLTR
jgi:hypothetical protein